jgi:hypothetical protein
VNPRSENDERSEGSFEFEIASEKLDGIGKGAPAGI